jgi:hypothetical protein
VRTSQETTAVVTATLGDIVATTSIKLLPPPVPLLAVSLGVRSDWNYGRFFAAGPDVSMLLRIPFLLDGTLHAGVELGYLPSIPWNVPTPDGGSAFRFFAAAPVVVEGAWRPTLFDDFTIHVGGGLGATIGDLSLTSAGARVPQRNIFFALGGQLALGIGYRVGPGDVEAMLRAGYFVPLEPPSHFFGTPVGTSLTLGYRFGI